MNKCIKGFSCGKSCIARQKNCLELLSGSASEVAQKLYQNITFNGESIKSAQKENIAVENIRAIPGYDNLYEPDTLYRIVEGRGKAIGPKIDKIIGGGIEGIVYRSGGKLIKEQQIYNENVANDYKGVRNILDSYAMQQAAHEVGLAPAVISVQRIGENLAIELEDLIKKSYVPLHSANLNPQDEEAELNKIDEKLRAAGIEHNDLHSGNVMYNTKTKQTLAIDFGFAQFTST